MIHNIRRSGDQSEEIPFQVGFQTSHEKLTTLETNMKKFVESNKKHFKSVSLSLKSIEQHNNKINGNFWLEFKGNFQNGGYYSQRRNAFMFAMKKEMVELKIDFVLPVQPMRIFRELDDDVF